MKTTRKFNLKKFLTNFLLVIFLMVTFISILDSVATGSPKIQYSAIVVHQGDTLWTIARKHRTKGTDIRSFIDQIYEANQLESAIITPGQTLKIPVS